jgi:hypothetical protein
MSLYVPEQCKLAVRPVADLVRDGKERLDNLKDTSLYNVELEARFGKWENSRFLSGVSFEFFERVLHRLCEFADWESSDDQWVPVRDYIYKCDDQNPPVRTRLIFEDDIVKEHAIKIPLKKKVLQYAPYNENNTKEENLFDLKIALSIEEKVKEDKLPNCISSVSFVRYKHVKRFRYKLWQFDLSQTWEGKSKQIVEKAKKENSVPKYEIEIECINLNEALLKGNQSMDYVSLALLLKCLDLYSDTNIEDNMCMLIPVF